MATPLVSICIPAFQEPEYFLRCLQSIHIQDFQNFEIIVTDDSPTDSISKICQKDVFQGRLKYFQNTQPLGSPENWNEGLRKASGKYIKILHHDDWLAFPRSLGTLVSLLEDSPEADFAFSATTSWFSEGKICSHHQPTAAQLRDLEKDPRVLVFGNFIGAPSVTIHRRKETAQYDSRLKWLVDSDLYMRILQENRRFRFSPEYLVCTFVGGHNRVTHHCQRNPDVELPELGILWRKFFPKGDLSGFGLKPYLFWSKLLARLDVISWNWINKKTGKIDLPIQMWKTAKLLYPAFRLYYKVFQ